MSAVSWHLSFEDLLALSGGGIVCIKVGQFPASSHPLLGAVVGFQSNNVFCLQSNAMKTISVPLSHALHQYLKNQMFK